MVVGYKQHIQTGPTQVFFPKENNISHGLEYIFKSKGKSF